MVKITVLRNFAQSFTQESENQPKNCGAKETDPIIQSTTSKKTAIQKNSNKPKKAARKALAKKTNAHKRKTSGTVKLLQRPLHRKEKKSIDKDSTVNKESSVRLDTNPCENPVEDDCEKPRLAEYLGRMDANGYLANGDTRLETTCDFVDTVRLDIMMKKLQNCDILESTEINYIINFLLAAAKVNSQQVRAHFKMLGVRGLLTEDVIQTLRGLKRKNIKGKVDPIEINMIRRERQRYTRSIRRRERAREAEEQNEAERENEFEEENFLNGDNDAKEENEAKETNEILSGVSAYKTTQIQSSSIAASGSKTNLVNEARIDIESHIKKRPTVSFAKKITVHYIDSNSLPTSELSLTSEVFELPVVPEVAQVAEDNISDQIKNFAESECLYFAPWIDKSSAIYKRLLKTLFKRTIPSKTDRPKIVSKRGLEKCTEEYEVEKGEAELKSKSTYDNMLKLTETLSENASYQS